jgi:hypothetical protein
MTLTALIDVAVGLIFTYLLLGLIASALQESVAAVMQWRGKALRDGLRALLHQPQDALFQRVFGHALIQPPQDSRLPSYVPARNFSTALTDALLDGSNAPLFSQVENSVAAMPNSAVKQALTSLLTQAAGDYSSFKTQVENWFDNAMDRVSGVYKRRAHAFALAFGLLVAVVFNVDSIDITRTLWLDPVKRAQIVEQAQRFADTHQQAASATSAATAESATQTLESLPIPLGWPSVRDHTDSWWGVAFIRSLLTPNLAGFWKLAGLFATALAVSLGAPFWFDLLQKFLNIRASGPVPAKTPPGPAS